MAKRVTCITKTIRFDPHERISHIGGDGWKITQAQAVSDIIADPYAYYVDESGSKSYLIVMQYGNNPYVRTTPDNTKIDNLLYLNSCP